MNRNTNWGYLPDYSHPNHTLRTPRMSKERMRSYYVRGEDRIPPIAWLYAGCFIFITFMIMHIGAVAGF